MALNQQAQLRRMQEEANDMLQAQQDEYVLALERRYLQFLRRVQDAAKAIRADMMGQYGTTRPTYADYIRFQGEFKLARVLEEELIRLNGEINPDLLDQMEMMYRNSYNMNAWSLDESTPPELEIKYTMPPEYQLRQLVSSDWKGAMFSQRIGAINDMMAKEIQNAVSQSMLSGDSSVDLANRLKSVIGDGSDDYSYRAKMIARTELLRSANMAREAILDENEDLIEDWIWVTRAISSTRLCPQCAERSGKTYSEVVKIAAMQGLSVDPPAHPMCGCTWMPKVKSWKKLLPKDLAKGMTEWDEHTMVIPSQQAGVSQVTPLTYARWDDRYLSEQERGAA